MTTLTGEVVPQLKLITIAVSSVQVAEETSSNGIANTQDLKIYTSLDASSRLCILIVQDITAYARQRQWACVHSSNLWNVWLPIECRIPFDHMVYDEIGNDMVQ